MIIYTDFCRFGSSGDIRSVSRLCYAGLIFYVSFERVMELTYFLQSVDFKFSFH